MDTSSIRLQLGAVSIAATLSTQDRGVVPFQIESIDQQLKAINYTSAYAKDPAYVYNTASFPYIWSNIWSAVPGNAYLLPTTPLRFFLNTSFPMPSSNLGGVNVILSDMFMDTLADTGNLALALQAMWTTVLRSAYYDAAPFFDLAQASEISMVSEGQMPWGKGGLIAVAVLVVVH